MKRKPELAPRNPLVAPALFRKAGMHRKTRKAERRSERMQTAILFRNSGKQGGTRTMSSSGGYCLGVAHLLGGLLQTSAG